MENFWNEFLSLEILLMAIFTPFAIHIGIKNAKAAFTRRETNNLTAYAIKDTLVLLGAYFALTAMLTYGTTVCNNVNANTVEVVVYQKIDKNQPSIDKSMLEQFHTNDNNVSLTGYIKTVKKCQDIFDNTIVNENNLKKCIPAVEFSAEDTIYFITPLSQRAN